MGLEEEAAPEGDGQRYSLRRPGSDPTELFGLREYQPGDRLNRVDWKLSQKTGAILVREGSLPVSDRVVLLAHLNKQRAASVAALGQQYYRQGMLQQADLHRPDYLRLPQAERERLARGERI